MKLYRNISIAFALGLVITACSDNSPASDNEVASFDENYDNESYTYDQYDDTNYDPSSEGYRRATMTITMDVQQVGEHENNDNSDATDPKTSKTEWSFNLSAHQKFDVWVNPDLSILVPEDGDYEERLSWSKSEPFFLAEDANGNPISSPAEGALMFSLQHRSTRPNASDYVKFSIDSEASGTVKGLSIQNMVPSIYGPGYEVDLSVDWDYQGLEVTRGTLSGGKTDVSEGVIEPDEPLEIEFYPPLNASDINDYPLEGDNTVPELTAQMRTRLREALEGLKQANPYQLAFARKRVGMKRIATKDSLELHYHTNDVNDAPVFHSNLLQVEAKMIKNLVDIKIEFKLK